MFDFIAPASYFPFFFTPHTLISVHQMWQTVQFRQRFILASHHFPNSVSRKQTIEWSLFRRYLQLCKKLCKNEKLCILQTWHRICIQLPNVRFYQIWTFSHRFFYICCNSLCRMLSMGLSTHVQGTRLFSISFSIRGFFILFIWNQWNT